MSRSKTCIRGNGRWAPATFLFLFCLQRNWKMRKREDKNKLGVFRIMQKNSSKTVINIPQLWLHVQTQFMYHVLRPTFIYFTVLKVSGVRRRIKATSQCRVFFFFFPQNSDFFFHIWPSSVNRGYLRRALFNLTARGSTCETVCTHISIKIHVRPRAIFIWLPAFQWHTGVMVRHIHLTWCQKKRDKSTKMSLWGKWRPWRGKTSE